MHERERHRLILSTVQAKPVATIQELIEMTGSSEATVRRDISALHVQGRLRRIRGGAEALNPPQFVGLAGRPFHCNETVNAGAKRAIARAAAALCGDGDNIIINGGTTTFQLVHLLAERRMHVLTNSFPLADHLLKHSKNTVTVPGGTVYREHNIILSPFGNDVAGNFHADKMFMGAQGIGRLGILETDPLVIQGEQRLVAQADKLIIMADSSKFAQRSALILCALDRVSTIITDDGIDADASQMLTDAGIELVVVHPEHDRATSAA